MKITYIATSPKKNLYEPFQKIYGHVIEVKPEPDTRYKILNTPFNRDLFERVNAEYRHLVGKIIRGNKCVIMREYTHNQSALELLKKEETLWK